MALTDNGNGLSAADVAAVVGNNGNGFGFGNDGGGLFWLLVLFLFGFGLPMMRQKKKWRPLTNFRMSMDFWTEPTA